MNLKAFFTSIRPIFGGQLTEAQVDGINTILAAWKAHGDGNPRHLAYILATAKHETAHTMQPVRETLASTDAKAKEILTKSFNAGKLTWVKKDYWSSGFFGRGFVQITHKGNYEYAGNKLGVDLVSDPSKALDPTIAATILVRGTLEGWFTGKKLSDFSSFADMRRVVNGVDRAQAIAAYADAFLASINNAPAEQSVTVPNLKLGAAGWLAIALISGSSVLVGIWQWISSLIG